jgi:hypothetical protein
VRGGERRRPGLARRRAAANDAWKGRAATEASRGGWAAAGRLGGGWVAAGQTLTLAAMSWERGDAGGTKAEVGGTDSGLLYMGWQFFRK